MHGVIVGLDLPDKASRDKRLYSYEDLNGEHLESRHAVITPYLFNGGALTDPHLVVREERRPVEIMNDSAENPNFRDFPGNPQAQALISGMAGIPLSPAGPSAFAARPRYGFELEWLVLHY